MINARLEEVNRRVASGLSPLSGPAPMMVMSEGDMSNIITSFDVIATVDSPNQKTIPFISAKSQREVEFDIIALPNTN